jgi:preprotein translocase subunit SecD
MKPALIFSALLILLSIGTVIARGGLNYGVDFVGGTIVEIKFQAPIDIAAVRSALSPAGFGGAEIKHFGSPSEVLISTEQSSTSVDGLEKAIRGGLDARWSGQYTVQRLEMVGPKVGADLRSKALWSLVASWALMLVYVTWRFEFKFAVGGILALVHDVIISVGIFTLLGRTFSLTVLATVLTIVGEVKVRKSVFLRQVSRLLGLERSQVETSRFEELLARPDLHESIDVVTVRAVKIDPATLLGIQAFLKPAGYLLNFTSGEELVPAPPLPLKPRGVHILIPENQSRLVVFQKQRIGQRST